MDDLLDLDWAKQPAKSAAAQQPPRNGASPAWSAGSSAGGGVSSSAYNFDVLTRAMPKTTTTTAQLPSGASVASQKPQTKPLSSGDDAFSSLLGFGGSGNAANGGGAGTTLSMAERLRQQTSTSSSSPTGSAQASAGRASPSAWDGLDNLGASSVASKPPPTRAAEAPKQPKNDDALWDFSTPAVASKAAARAAPPVATARAAEAPAAAKASKDPFDFAEFEDPGAFQSSALGGGEGGARKAPAKGKPPQPTSLFDTSDTFDDGDGDDDDDLLGELGKRPARPLASTYEHAKERHEPPKPAASTRAGAASPPPHILGQVVEMGFSPQQAREALARTGSGQDVQAALEMLLQSSGQNSANGRGTPQQTASRRGARQDTAEGEESDRRMAMRLQREEQERHGGGGGGGGGPRWQQTGNHAKHDADSRAGTPDWQKQADQLYAQASELGANVFSKANSLWATAKSQAQRALEEHTASAAGSSAPSSGRASPATASDRARSRRWAVPSRDGGGGSGGGARQGKPKWMIDAEAAEEAEGAEPSKTDRQGGFKDDDDDDVQEAPPFVAPTARKTREEARVVPARTEVESGKSPSNANLWGSDDVQRRPSPVATQAAAATAPSARGGTPSQQQQRRNGQTAASAAATRPATLRTRRLVADDAGAVQSAMQQKERGNALYKRGAYGEAEAAYTSALAAMDGNAHSVRRVVLYNNRANARLKNGDAKGALDDTMAVLRLIVVDEHGKGSPFVLFRPSQESALPQPDYADVNLREGYAKALLRRAQAEELLERWDPALSVWSLLGKYEREEGSGQNGVANMRAAEQGKGRCSKMLKGGGDTESAPVPRVRASATRAVAKAEAQAKERIRSENAAAAAEEAAKDGLRDSVDARIVAWRTGKENNVRALLASLHDVVWPGLAWKRVGMHELVMEKQVKIVYMRAIGKLHPDKLTPKANTLEERMLGGAVFSVLNDAWSAAQA